MLSTRLRPRIRLTHLLFGTSTMGSAKHKSVYDRPCPTCGAPSMKKTRPFCSKRCADIDLGRWFQGAYAIPAVDTTDDSITDADLAASGKMRESNLGDGHS